METRNDKILKVVATLANRANYCYEQHIFGNEHMAIKGQALEEAVREIAIEFGLDEQAIWAPFIDKAHV